MGATGGRGGSAVSLSEWQVSRLPLEAAAARSGRVKRQHRTLFGTPSCSLAADEQGDGCRQRIRKNSMTDIEQKSTGEQSRKRRMGRPTEMLACLEALAALATLACEPLLGRRCCLVQDIRKCTLQFARGTRETMTSGCQDPREGDAETDKPQGRADHIEHDFWAFHGASVPNDDVRILFCSGRRI